MEFICQKDAIEELKSLAESDRHSILIEGSDGSGKTYLATEYAKMINIDDIINVKPRVNDIRGAIDATFQQDNRVLICVENLDTGVKEASYTLLKSLEEPTSKVYIVITCRNSKKVPDTIISRSTSVNIAPPVDKDIDMYAQNINLQNYHMVHNSLIWKCVKTFSDANTVLNMNANQLQYFDSLKDLSAFNGTVSDIIWALGHYNDEAKTATPIELVIRYIMHIRPDKHSQVAGVECLRELSKGTVASHAVLAKYVFEMKYAK